MELMMKIMVRDIWTAFMQYAPGAAATGAIVMIAVHVSKYRVRFRQEAGGGMILDKKKCCLLYFSCMYPFMVISITFLSREPGSRSGTDLLLFSTFSRNPYGNRYPIENILLLIPFGWLLPLLWRPCRRLRWCLGAGILFSVVIEVSQYITKRGFLQVDDIMTNALGTMIGFGISVGIRKKIDEGATGDEQG